MPHAHMHSPIRLHRPVEDMTFAELEQLREDLGISRERLAGAPRSAPPPTSVGSGSCRRQARQLPRAASLLSSATPCNRSCASAASSRRLVRRPVSVSLSASRVPNPRSGLLSMSTLDLERSAAWRRLATERPGVAGAPFVRRRGRPLPAARAAGTAMPRSALRDVQRRPRPRRRRARRLRLGAHASANPQQHRPGARMRRGQKQQADAKRRAAWEARQKRRRRAV